jgi:hypothetical protein
VTTKGLDRLRGWASKLLAAGWLRTVLTSHHPAVNSRATDPTKPPTWVDEFSQAMTSSDRRWSEADVLDVVAAATDLDAWLRDPRPYEGRFHRQGWESAADDLDTAAGLIGPRLHAALGRDLTSALSATAGLPGSDPTPTRPAAQTTLAALRARWTDPAVLEAAWSDIADACRDHRTPDATVAARRDLFWQLVRAADRNAKELGRLLAGVLDDYALVVEMARVRLGDLPNPGPGAWPRHDQPAGLGEPERIGLCQRLLAMLPMPAHHVVWVAFDRASLDGTTQTVGPISFYDGAWVRATLEHNGLGRSQLPAELTSPDSPLRSPDLPKGDRIVLARVDLSTGVFPDAPRVAAEQAQAVVTVASVRAGDRYWRPLDGYIHTTDGRITGWSSFGLPFQRADVAPDLDRTADELSALAATLGPQLPVADPALTETIDALGWWQSATDQPPLAAIVLDVRVLELVAARVTNGAWYDYLDSYHRDDWIRSRIISTLHSVVFAAMRGYHVVPSSEHPQLAGLEATLFEPIPGGRHLFHADRALAAFPTLSRIWPVHDHLGRQLRSLATDLSSPAALEAWCQALGDRWTRARARLQRVRNALAHGGPLTPAADTVHRLAHQRAGKALSFTLEALLDGRGAVKAHEDARSHMTAWRNGVAGAPSVHDALFPP